MNDGHDFHEELLNLLRQDQKLEAIKRYRQRTGVSLAEAKDAIEALERGDALPSRPQLDANLEQDLIVLLEKGKKIEAIKMYREATGVDLKEAKDTIEALAMHYGLSKPRSGCFGVMIFLVVMLLTAAQSMRH